MATFSVQFLGCKVSHTDAQEVRERLAAAGHREVGEAAEIAVVNTCCVTHEAVRKSRQAARRAARTSGRVYVTGCAANLPGAFSGLPDRVRVVSRRSEETAAALLREAGAPSCADTRVGFRRVRAFVKVQDGCSFGCSFCVIPQVRGPSRSRPASAVLAEVRRRIDQGHREVVLTGINLGCYRDRSAGFDLARLVREAGSVSGLRRLRLSSVEVNHLTDGLVRALRETPTASPHLHVPLQAGDDGILRAMGRRYTVATYLRRLSRADGFNVTTDVIVGFPGEDERAFARTLRTVEAAGATAVHVFPYSPRPGTRTAGEDSVPPAEKRERSERLRRAVAAAALTRRRKRVGSTDVVLVDRPGRGYGDDYTPWLVPGEVGEFVRARAVRATEDGLVGVAV
ncbi:MAG: MiaB/RimO family radical SAM methylthiotransferase [Thermoleophilia bacterium]|nr:MiaB/RimO family radical SAM methylthiotransferase [Thermoleophilia bacterium]